MSIWSIIEGTVTFKTDKPHFSFRKCVLDYFYDEYTLKYEKIHNGFSFEISVCQDGHDAYSTFTIFLDALKRWGGRYDVIMSVRQVN